MHGRHDGGDHDILVGRVVGLASGTWPRPWSISGPLSGVGRRSNRLEQNHATDDRQFSFPDESGTTWLAFTDYGPREGARTLICVHGLTGHSRQFDALGAALARDYHVIAFDLAGRGRSGWLADKSGYHLTTYARHIKGLLAYRGLERWIGSASALAAGWAWCWPPKRTAPSNI